MRRFCEIVITILVILIAVVAVMYGIARMEDKKPAAEQETQAVTETIVQTEPTEQTEPEVTAEALSQEAEKPVQTGYDTVPQYFQTDYPYIKFGNGTIGTSGCSITCLAMVATYLTGQEYMPDQLAYHFGSFGKTNIERLDHGNEQMQLPCQRTENVQEVLAALKEGKVVIAMMDEESIFTTTQHFIVLAGMTEDGKIRINDPFGPNYTADKYLENGFANGFEDYDIMRGFSGAWIYDKSAMPEELFLYDAAMPEQPATRYEGYNMPEEDIYTLACFAWAAAREESEIVQQAVVEVVLNRVVSEEFPNTVHEVLYGTDLYSTAQKMQRAEPDYPQYRAVGAAMEGPYVLPEDVLYFAEWYDLGVAWGELGKYTFLYSR